MTLPRRDRPKQKRGLPASPKKKAKKRPRVNAWGRTLEGGVPAKQVKVRVPLEDRIPAREWVSFELGNRFEGDGLDGMAARYVKTVGEHGLLKINADYVEFQREQNWLVNQMTSQSKRLTETRGCSRANPSLVSLISKTVHAAHRRGVEKYLIEYMVRSIFAKEGARYWDHRKLESISTPESLSGALTANSGRLASTLTEAKFISRKHRKVLEIQTLAALSDLSR